VDVRAWPGQGRHIEAEEEDYFNTDDDDEFVPTISSQQWVRGQVPPSINTLKRKRRPSLNNFMRVLRPPNLNSLRTGSIGNLVEYGEDEDDLGDVGNAEDDPLSSLRSLLPSTPPGKSPPKTSHSHVLSLPTTPKLMHRQVQQSSAQSSSSSDDDEEDNLLESLVRSKPPSRSSSVAGTPSKLSIGPVRLSEKRRREDDDDGLLERLSKAKKPDLGSENEGLIGGRSGSMKVGDDPPKKIKLKFGTSLALASSPSTPLPSEAGAKDRDTG
jgi:protein phosphatase 4 regulatory subunit 3